MFVELKKMRQTNPKCSSRLFRPSSVSCLKVKRSWKRFVFLCFQSIYKINKSTCIYIYVTVSCCISGGSSHWSVLWDARHPRSHLWEQTEAGGNRWRLPDSGENLRIMLVKVHIFHVPLSLEINRLLFCCFWCAEQTLSNTWNLTYSKLSTGSVRKCLFAHGWRGCFEFWHT